VNYTTPLRDVLHLPYFPPPQPYDELANYREFPPFSCLQSCNEDNEVLLKKINANGKIHMVPAKIKDTFFLRMAVCSRFSEPTDMDIAWTEVASLV